MREISLFRARRAALATAAVGAAMLLCMGRPSRAQQNLPTASVTAPVAAASSGADTRVSLSYALPPGLRLQRNPAIVVTDPQGRLFEFHPAFVTPGSPTSTGYRDLPTGLYPPGVYQVHIQLDYLTPDGQSATFVSPSRVLTVPAR